MSGSHQFYTETGRALPLPPRRTPSRHSTVLRLPTHRAEQEQSTTLRANSPGRVEAPHGAEISTMTAKEQRASQLVVYRGPRSQSKKQASSRRVPSSAAPSRRSTASPAITQAGSESPAGHDGHAMPRADVALTQRSRSSTRSSPRLNRAKSPSTQSSDSEGRDDGAATSTMQSIVMSSARRSQPAPASETRGAATPSVAERYSHTQLKAAAATPVTPHTNRAPQPASVASSPVPIAPPAYQQQQQQQQQQRQQPHPLVTPPLPAAAAHAHNAGMNGSRIKVVREYSASDASSFRPEKHSVRSPPARHVDPHGRSPNSIPSSALSALHQQQHSHPGFGMDPHHTHEYSQTKLDERRASRPRVVTDASFRPIELDEQAGAVVVPPPPVPRYSVRSPRNGDDVLEMNMPIAERVRAKSSSIPRHTNNTAGGGRAAAVDVGGAGVVEGTELLPALPRLQGQRPDPETTAERTYRTVVRFIEYQPEEERPGLEAMLADYAGHEEALCDVLGEAYGEDFELMKAVGSSRVPSVPLLADRSRTAASATSNATPLQRSLPAPTSASSSRPATSHAAARCDNSMAPRSRNSSQLGGRSGGVSQPQSTYASPSSTTRSAAFLSKPSAAPVAAAPNAAELQQWRELYEDREEAEAATDCTSTGGNSMSNTGGGDAAAAAAAEVRL